jgi:hypothetical protein
MASSLRTTPLLNINCSDCRFMPRCLECTALGTGRLIEVGMATCSLEGIDPVKNSNKPARTLNIIQYTKA